MCWKRGCLSQKILVSKHQRISKSVKWIVLLDSLAAAPALVVETKETDDVTSVRAPPSSDESGRKRWDSRHSVFWMTLSLICNSQMVVEFIKGMVWVSYKVQEYDESHCSYQNDFLTYGRNIVWYSRDRWLTINTGAALIGDLGLGHLDQIASTLNSVLGGATTNHITLLTKVKIIRH